MKKKWISVVLVVLMLMLTACGAKESNSGGSDGDKVLKVVTNAAYAPMEYMEGDKVVGFDVDLIKAVAKEAGYEVAVEHTGWESMFVEIDDKISDIAMAAITINDERKETYDFSVPYYASSNIILIPENSKVKTIDDLKDSKIAVQNGTTGQSAAESILGKNSEKVKKFENTNLAIQELLNGGADAVVADKPVIESYVKNNPGQKLAIIEDEKAFSTDYFGIMFPKGSTLKSEFDQALNTLYENGKYTKLYEDWFGTKPNVEDLKAQQ